MEKDNWTTDRAYQSGGVEQLALLKEEAQSRYCGKDYV